MDEHDARGKEPAAEPQPSNRPTGEPPPAESPQAELPAGAARHGSGLPRVGRTVVRVVAGIVLVPWILLYGVTAAFGLYDLASERVSGEGAARFSEYVEVRTLPYVLFGVALLAAAAVLAWAATLMILGGRRQRSWTAVTALALALVAASIWAAGEGSLGPAAWMRYFGILPYAVALGLATLLWPRSPDTGDDAGSAGGESSGEQ